VILLVCFVLAAGAAIVVGGLVQARHPLTDPTAYLHSLDRPLDESAGDEFAELLSNSFLARVVRPFGSAALGYIGRLTPIARRDKIKEQLQLAGLNATVRAEDFLATQILAAIGGVAFGLVILVFGSGSPTMRFGLLILTSVIGVIGPEAWLSRKVEARKHRIFMDLPDVLDLLAISVEAGVGFEGAIDIVCQHFDSVLAREFSLTLREMALGLPRRDALQNLKKRTQVPELNNFILALTQADALGMPIGRVLHSQAGEMRNRRRQYAREKAGKMPVKILFPLVAFIFPAILIITLGPAASTMKQILK
jgi:tight adherence protein C